MSNQNKNNDNNNNSDVIQYFNNKIIEYKIKIDEFRNNIKILETIKNDILKYNNKKMSLNDQENSTIIHQHKKDRFSWKFGKPTVHIISN